MKCAAFDCRCHSKRLQIPKSIKLQKIDVSYTLKYFNEVRPYSRRNLWSVRSRFVVFLAKICKATSKIEFQCCLLHGSSNHILELLSIDGPIYIYLRRGLKRGPSSCQAATGATSLSSQLQAAEETCRSCQPRLWACASPCNATSERSSVADL